MNAAELRSRLEKMPQHAPVRGPGEIVDVQFMFLDGEEVVYLYQELTHWEG